MATAARVPAALALAVYAGLALSESARLFAVDTRVLVATGAVLALGAIGLAARQLWAHAFSLLFLGVSAVCYGVAGAWIAYAAFRGEGGGSSGWEGVRALVLGVAAAAGLLACFVSSALGVTLLAAWRVVAAGRSSATWLVSILVACGGVGIVGWTVGHDYLYRRMATRNDCLAGRGLACYGLANDKERFSATLRSEFARRGCEAFYDGACRQLAEFLTPSLGADSPEARVLAARCQAGKAERCLELGKHLLGGWESAIGVRYLETACRVDLKRCVSAARVAREGGAADLSRSLLERGCDLEDPGSCTTLLREVGPGLPPVERLRLQMKTCLIGDVNDCRPLIRGDLASVCPIICEGVTENRFQSCDHCAKEAEAQGQPALARQWRAASCEKGYRWACSDLDRMPERSMGTEVEPRISRPITPTEPRSR